MNVWRCDRPGCEASCVGVGEGANLIAVGWYVRQGLPPFILCPVHRPDYDPSAEYGQTIGKRLADRAEELLRALHVEGP